MANREMSELWNGQAATPWVEAPERYDAMLGDLGRHVLEAAALQPGEAVLDVGCGSGMLSREAGARVGPGGRVLGVDISVPLVGLARRRTPDEHVRFEVADAQADPVPGAPYDVVLSRFGVMFFEDAVAAFGNLLAATAPGGRLAFVAWQEALRNEWVVTAIGAIAAHVGMPPPPAPGAPGPFSLADPDRVRSVLRSAGWTDVSVEPVETALLVGGPLDVDGVVSFYTSDAFGKFALAAAEPAARAAAVEALREAVAERIGPDGLRQGAAAWLVTARRDPS